MSRLTDYSPNNGYKIIRIGTLPITGTKVFECPGCGCIVEIDNNYLDMLFRTHPEIAAAADENDDVYLHCPTVNCDNWMFELIGDAAIMDAFI